jgi:nucleotide-binding universal stress UspA family protein
MYRNILVAFDNSPRGKYVFEAALALAKANNASLMLLHILSKDAQDNSTIIISDSGKSLRKNLSNCWSLLSDKRKLKA